MAMAAMLFAPTAAAGSDVAVPAAALEEFCGQSTNAKAELLCNDADLGFRTRTGPNSKKCVELSSKKLG